MKSLIILTVGSGALMLEDCEEEMTIQALKEEIHANLGVHPNEIELFLAKRDTWLKCSRSEIEWLERGNMLSSIKELLTDDKKMDPQRKVGDFGFRGIGEDEQDEVHVLMKLPDHVVQNDLRWFEKVRRLKEDNERGQGHCCGVGVSLLPWKWFSWSYSSCWPTTLAPATG